MKIWIDLDNTPHVPFFAPIIEELELRGHRVVLTARDAFQVCELADRTGMSYTRIGRHYGKNVALKVVGLGCRSAQLLPFCLRSRPDLALSHGSRSQLLLANMLGIPTAVATDYEHGRILPFGRPKWLIYPDAISGLARPQGSKGVEYYRGLKEDVYAPRFRPDPSLLGELGLNGDETIIVVRPPATEAHYHNPESDVLLVELMSRLSGTEGVKVVLVPRNAHQQTALHDAHPEWFSAGRTIVPARAVDGMNLIWSSDLVVSGGGTMNREAAALGVPVYSIFRGPLGAVDRELERDGRLVMITTAEDVSTKIRIARRSKEWRPDAAPRPALLDIIGAIERIVAAESERGRANKARGSYYAAI